MAETIHVDNDASSLKAEANQVVSDSQENGKGCNGTTNGNVCKDQGKSTTDTASVEVSKT